MPCYTSATHNDCHEKAVPQEHGVTVKMLPEVYILALIITGFTAAPWMGSFNITILNLQGIGSYNYFREELTGDQGNMITYREG